MKKFVEKFITIVGGVVIIAAFLIMMMGHEKSDAATLKNVSSANHVKQEYVYEVFEITEIKKGGKEIYGDIVYSTSGAMGTEGIFLDNTIYKQYGIKKKLKQGDIIIVKYDKKDYDQCIWDNMLDIKILKSVKK
jgi:hypothetical protein